MRPKDSDLHGDVLQLFYDLRNGQDEWLSVLQMPQSLNLDPDPRRVFNVCGQLGEHGLITWHSDFSTPAFDGVGKITARGVDVIEGNTPSPITLTFHDHSMKVTASQNVHVGNQNTLVGDVQIEKIISPIDGSLASADEKQEAKSLIEQVVDNPLLKSVLGSFLRPERL